ncbi:hypothetical protein BCR34DRAFT_500123, partial [Clohesyomyces aquaticus]
QPRIPDILYCVAGSTAHELGFLADIEPELLQRCMNDNYYSHAYPGQCVLQTLVHRRKIVFVNGLASLTPIPGYIADSGRSTNRGLWKGH